jgi:hypothetical protein
MDALVGAARRLLVLDPDRFMSVLALCSAYLSIYEQPDETLLELLARCEMVLPRTRTDKTSA